MGVVLCVSAHVSAQVTLVEAARHKGSDVTSLINVDVPEADLNMLLGEGAIVARGHFIAATSRLTPDHRNVETEYRFQFAECLRCDGQLPGTTVSIVRLGGTVQLESGIRVRTQVQGFPSFDDDDDYVLFLSRNNGHYAVRYGPQGAFRVRGQRAEPLAKASWIAQLERPLEVADLAGLIAQTPTRKQ
jgi:hypothetical protein